MLGMLVVAAAVAAFAVPAASAITVSCPGNDLARPFAPWLDPGNYTLVPGGTFERGAQPWTLERGAGTVAGNERFLVNGPGDSRSLALPAGSSATSPSTCVGLDSPTVRLFARNTGSPLSVLEVDAVVRTTLGIRLTLPIGLFVAGPSWQPTPITLLLANIPDSLLPSGDSAAVALRFVPHGRGAWQIDDVYVDPFRGR
jgi:hypothetical protein